METAVTVERRGHVLLIGLNRPAKRNVFDVAMIEQLAAAYYDLEHDENIRCGVLFGHGDHFTGGLDLAENGEAAAFARLDSDMADLFETADGREGLQSFAERREARFAGR
jgi:enoyl-CoA hydratase